MQCIRPIKAGFDQLGNITYSSKKITNELAPFQFPCRKCLPCRLAIGREKGIRAWHESQMHENSIFLTLTYDKEHLKSPRLIYPEFQQFMKSLLEKVNRDIKIPENRIKIPYMVTGEYGEINKRPHWHALLFNYRPPDSRRIRTTDNGEPVFTSKILEEIWKKGNLEYGTVTMDSASYVARYAAKKLVHGKDEDHDYHPIHKTSSKHAIGKRWIEKYYEQTFSLGYINLPNGEKAGIPRYYQDWLKKTHPEAWMKYASTVKLETAKLAKENQDKDETLFLKDLAEYKGGKYPKTRSKVKLTILKQKFKILQGHQKL